jgi:hypothetical protein
MNHFWAVLGIAPTDDTKAVKKAYAVRLKQVRPDEDPAGFQRLREAYEWALKYGVVWAKHHLEESDDEDDFESDDIDDDASAGHPFNHQPSIDLSNDQAQLKPVPVHIIDNEISFRLPPSMLGLDLPATTALEPEANQRPGNHPPLALAADFEQPEPAPPSLIARVDDELPNYSNLPPIADLRTRTLASEPPIPPPTPPVKTPVPTVSPATDPIITMVPIELPSMSHRSIEVFLQALWDHGQTADSPAAIKQWLTLQSEFESLHQRMYLDDALQDALVEHRWPWTVVIAVSELLEWGTIGNAIDDELEHAIIVAHKQAEIIHTPKPSWRKRWSLEGYRYKLRQPFRWRDLLWQSLWPSKTAIDSAFFECLERGIDPQAVYDPMQVRVQAALRQPGFNLFKVIIGVWRCVFWPLAISLVAALATRKANVVVTLAWIAIFLTIWAIGTAAKWCNAIIWSQYPEKRHPPFLYQMLGILAAASVLESLYSRMDFSIVLLPCFIAVFVAGKRWADSFGAILLFGGGGLGGFAIIAALVDPNFNAERWMGLAGKLSLLIAALGVHYYVRRHIGADGIYRPPAPIVVAQQENSKIPWWLIIWVVILIARFAGK